MLIRWLLHRQLRGRDSPRFFFQYFCHGALADSLVGWSDSAWRTRLLPTIAAVATSLSSTLPKNTRLFSFHYIHFICSHDEIIIRINETKTRIIRATYGPWSAALHCAALHYTHCFRPSSYRLLVTSTVFSDPFLVGVSLQMVSGSCWHLLVWRCVDRAWGFCLLDRSNSRIHCTTGEVDANHLDSGHCHNESVLDATLG